ncbi:hypothetical protein JHK87_011990 [Glycine soja]|nr:hypothetical protein JHK87_011990 [Glycine soja]
MSTQSSTASNVNNIEVPLTYHRQWRSYYPTYVLFDYNGRKHFVRLRKYDTRYFFADGLKEFIRAHDINDSVIIRFFAPSKDTYFDVDVMGPIHRQTRGRSVVTTRRHIFIADVTQEMMEHNNPLVLPAAALNFLFGSKKYILVQRGYDIRNQWHITVHNGLPSVAEPWFQYLSKNNLMAGDEVVFFFRFDEHVWEVIFRNQVIWDEDLSN